MNRFLKTIFTAAALTLLASNASSQIGIAVAKDSDGSALRYSVVSNAGTLWDCERAARKNLEQAGYTKTSTLTGGQKHGHKLTSGVYVVVKVRYKINGRWKTSVGMGASTSSYAEAEQRAIKNLSQYDWSWAPNRATPTVVERNSF